MISHRIRSTGRFGSRPRALTGSIAVLVLFAATACSSDNTEPEDRGAQIVDLNADPAACGENDRVDAVDRASGPFTYTDGRGRTISLDSQPTRIIADEESAAALMSYGIKPIAIWSTTPMGTSPILSCLDLSGIESVGESWGTFDFEKAAGLDPDLVIGEFNPRFNQFGKLTTTADSSKADTIDQLAPTLGVTLDTTSTAQTIENYAGLASSLGVDLDTPQLADIKSDYDAAVANFEKVAAERRDLTGVGVWPLDVAYVLDPSADPDFSDYQRWGLKMYAPDGTDDGYWKKVSWENVSSVDADVAFVYHDVANAADVKLADIPSRYPGFDTIAAVDKQQMVLWDYGANKSYSRYTNTINVYADALSKAQKVTAE
ncbi:ABC transporter substrate-binding protein [Rhodococcoides yunnanense]|uniref:ABC transporter substrate-binding protein n=1 Tax=Rhodococcoides yunnanense TaxID=278209 RepID=A0ABU4BK09_9NOCA|nr:ABC transporter substrate-binding protein [Rhodococcus yunnanensis]MDV6264544.1 ABC transporter substrate-binding protein [Rhodococcus yunnanensis]